MKVGEGVAGDWDRQRYSAADRDDVEDGQLNVCIRTSCRKDFEGGVITHEKHDRALSVWKPNGAGGHD